MAIKKILLPIKPVITNEMKAEHMGEYQLELPEYCPLCDPEDLDDTCEICEGEGQYTREIPIPWDTCKKIYQAMYATAVKAAGETK